MVKSFKAPGWIVYCEDCNHCNRYNINKKNLYLNSVFICRVCRVLNVIVPIGCTRPIRELFTASLKEI